MSKLSVYWSVCHRRPQDYDYFKRLQPSVLKIMDGGAPDYAWAKANLPNSLIVARDWALSEQHADMLKDPIGTGRRHAEEWHKHADRLGFDRTKTLVLGNNEPQVWMPGVAEALRQYTIAMCDRATELGLRVGAMQLSVGWPANTGTDTPPDWTAFHGVEAAIKRNNGALVTHEYWADNGPNENWGWWAGRTLKCPWNVPIVIGECGVDMYVKAGGGVPHNQRGWHGRMHPTRYAQELAEYVGKMSADGRFVGACVFASDFASHEWFSFDLEAAYGAILSTPIPDVTPTKTRLPSVGTGTQVEQPMNNAIIEPRVAQAILKIESGGRTHGDDGRIIIRFEAHIFKTYFGNDFVFHQHFGHDAHRPWVDQTFQGKPLHTGRQSDEYAAFEFAKTLNANAAYMSISMGAPQIMGFNHARIGYPSAAAMFASFQDAQLQTIGFINFCLSDPDLAAAMRRKDWKEIARRYNGSGAINTYAPLLEQAYNQLGA